MLRKMLAFLAAMIMLCTALPAGATEAAETADPAGLTVQDLEALNGGPLSMHMDQGNITFLGGSCSADPVKSFEDAASVIDSMLPLMGGDGDTAFEPWRVVNDPAGNVYYVFQQVSEDVLVPGGAVKIITDADGNMTGLTGSVVPVTEEEAEGKSEGAY